MQVNVPVDGLLVVVVVEVVVAGVVVVVVPEDLVVLVVVVAVVPVVVVVKESPSRRAVSMGYFPRPQTPRASSCSIDQTITPPRPLLTA